MTDVIIYRIPLMPRKKAGTEEEVAAPSATPGKVDPKKDKGGKRT